MKYLLILSMIFLSSQANAQISSETAIPDSSKKADVWSTIQTELGIDESDMGYRPKGWFSRFPHSSDIPYKTIFFDDLFAEPQRIYPFVKTAATAVEKFLDPDYTKSDRLLKLNFYTGVCYRTSQLRCYNASLYENLDSIRPFIDVIKRIYAYARKDFEYSVFGKAADFPNIEKEINQKTSAMPFELKKAVAEQLLHLLNACKLREAGMRNVDYKKAAECSKIRRLNEIQFDGLEFYPNMDDCAEAIDMNSIYFAGHKLLQSSVELNDKITKIDLSGLSELYIDIMTPIGRVIVSGIGDDQHNEKNVLLSLDLGGNDIYTNSAGATSLEQGVSLCVDISGDDKYVNKDEFLAAQGSGLFGAGMLLDVSGDDTYQSERMSQGAAMFGMGILADLDGDDSYKIKTSGQGGAYFGVALLVDQKGDDKYAIWGDGQGFGGSGGSGCLADYSGDDTYYAEPFSKIANRGDFHSKDAIHNYSYAQGAGAGRRGDISDGHSWAGGVGTLIDIKGDDNYTAGAWAQGCGYWYGSGFLYDGDGDDKYLAKTWSMSCGAHFCIAGFIDENGDDEFDIWEETGTGMGFAHDYTVALFLNRNGDDIYKLNSDGMGFAINMSQVFFFDLDGDDQYITGGSIADTCTDMSFYGRPNTRNHYGRSDYRSHNPPPLSLAFHLYSDQISIFADINGDDKYIKMDYLTGDMNKEPRMRNNFRQLLPDAAIKAELSNKRHFGIGIDMEGSSDIEMFKFPIKMK